MSDATRQTFSDSLNTNLVLRNLRIDLDMNRMHDNDDRDDTNDSAQELHVAQHEDVKNALERNAQLAQLRHPWWVINYIMQKSDSVNLQMVVGAMSEGFRDGVFGYFVPVNTERYWSAIFKAHGPRVSSPSDEEYFSCEDSEDIETVEEIVDHGAEAGAIRDEELMQLQAEHDWADGVVMNITNPTLSFVEMSESDYEDVFLFRFTRTPKEFVAALQQEPELMNIRTKLEEAGHACLLIGENAGAQVFVWPEQYQSVMAAVHALDQRLFTSNIVILRSLMPLLEDIVAKIPSKKNVRVKKDAKHLLTSVAASQHNPHDCDHEQSDGQDWGCVLATVGTFLCAVRELREGVTQSTTDAHRGMNPRRFV